MITLQCKSVSKSHGKLNVLKGLDFKLKSREFLSLLGPSGSGKSSLLRIIAGLDRLDNGLVYHNNIIVSSKDTLVSPDKRGIGLVFQDVALFPHLSVADNIAFGLKGGKKKNGDRIDELLDLIGLAHFGSKLPHQMSGGENQRVALARALAPKPDLILLDEPFSSLDFQLRTKVRRDLHRVLKDAKVSAILVTHDQWEAFSFSDRVLVMRDGKIVQDGSPEEIYQNPVNPWVASFVGESNFVSKQVASSLCLDEPSIKKQLSRLGGPFLVRPEDLESTISPSDQEKNAIIESVEFGGDHFDLTVRLLDFELTLHMIGQANKKWKAGQSIKIISKKLYSWDEKSTNIKIVA